MARIGIALVLVLGASVAHAQHLDAVAASIGSKLEAERRAVAVVDFTDLQGNATELGRYLAEELSVALAVRASGYRVVDRTHLRAILQEHKLAATGVIDPATSRQLGKLAGVDTLITGTLTPLGDSIRLSVKALDAETASMVAATALNIPRTSAIDDLLGRGVGAEQSDGRRSEDPGRKRNQRIEAGGFTFELEGCSANGRCQLFVTAVEDSNFSAGATAWDENGNTYHMENVRIANQIGSVQLIAGVRTPLLIRFPFSSGPGRSLGGRLASRSGAMASSGPTSLSVLELEFYAAASFSPTKVRFRDIPLQ